MKRKEELKKIKQIIKENIEDYNCGIYNTRNIVGDFMINLYEGKYFTLDACYHWPYYELFGTTDEEFKEIKEYYNSIKGW